MFFVLFSPLLSYACAFNTTFVAFQFFQAPVDNVGDIELLNDTTIAAMSLPSTCTTKDYLMKANDQNSTVARISVVGLTYDNATIILAKKGSSYVVLELMVSFPSNQNEVSFLGYIRKAVAIKFRSFAVNEVINDICSKMKCPKQPYCFAKMDGNRIKRNVREWKEAEEDISRDSPTCAHATKKGLLPIEEGEGRVHRINASRDRANIVLNLVLELNTWSSSLPESFFKGSANSNMTLVASTLFFTYEIDAERENPSNWFFTTNGMVNLVLMCILGFNFLVILFALLFWACNRSKRAFEMEIWEFALSNKDAKNGAEF